MKSNKHLVALGECMMELVPSGPDSFRKSYAGDTFNALVYAKRFDPELKVGLLTAVGDDQVSHHMMQFWQSQGIETQSAVITNKASIGLYSIATDDMGERSFSYWRKGSAASQIMQLASIEQLAARAQGADIVFFSGIGLAILAEQDKEKMIELVKLLRANGSRIAFDPNYRAKMWHGKAHAIEWLEQAYAVSDILMPGVEEHQVLFGHQSERDVLNYCRQFSAQELVIKAGSDGVWGYQDGKKVAHQPFTPAPKQVDSTAAGDSFAGTYLAARISGDNIEQSIKHACFVAGHVVQYQGAITPLEAYAEHTKSVISSI